MAEYEKQPELSKADLAAIDLVIAEMEERGIETFSFEPDVFITTITPILRIITHQTAMEGDLGPVDRTVLTEETVRKINAGEVTLEKLVEARKRLGKE